MPYSTVCTLRVMMSRQRRSLRRRSIAFISAMCRMSSMSSRPMSTHLVVALQDFIEVRGAEAAAGAACSCGPRSGCAGNGGPWPVL